VQQLRLSVKYGGLSAMGCGYTDVGSI